VDGPRVHHKWSIFLGALLEVQVKIWEIPCPTHVLTLLLVEHTNALDHVVVGNQLIEISSMGRSNHLGGPI
jgi:hypothetical protein